MGEKLSVFDWCVIFSNLLSNAVEAGQKEENGKIEIYVQIQQDCVAITVGNTCAPQESGKNLKTSKGDELLHGLGLKNVEEIVKKYDGQWKTKVQDGWFEAEIVF